MPVTLSIIISKKSIILVYNFGIIDSTSSFRHTGLCHYTVVTQISLEWSHYVTTYAPKSEKCPVQYYWDSTALLVHPSRAQTSERIHDLDHSEGDVYASFNWPGYLRLPIEATLNLFGLSCNHFFFIFRSMCFCIQFSTQHTVYFYIHR